MGRPHGVDGGFSVAEATERLELLDPGRLVRIGGHEHEIKGRRGSAEHPIVTLMGVDDRSAAESLRGAAIEVPRAALGLLAEGEFLVDDLIGCQVVDGERTVGHVTDVLLMPAADTLEVEPNGGGDALLVPLVGDAVRAIDLDAGRVDVDTTFLE